MADHSQLGRVPEDEDSTSGPYNNDAAIHDEPRSQSPATVHTVPRRNSSVSHVSLDFFDPAGVEQLSCTVSHMSAAVDTNDIPDVPIQKMKSRSTVETTTTLAAPKGDEPFDLERTLRTVMKRKEKSNIHTRELGVMFQDLRIIGLGSAESYQSTFGSLFNPRALLQSLRETRKPPLRDILSGFEGVVRPGEMLLVLGSPGSGCSTFLKTLANQRHEYRSVEGEVHYDSFSPAEIEKHYRGDVLYCDEDDIHFPTLSVDQTLCFAAKMRTPHVRMDGQSREELVRLFVDCLETVFGLRHVKNSPVGDAALRGVSGGEKKRVSIAEALALRSKINSWDNSTRGLDASTALEFVRALRIGTDIGRMTTIVSLYQAGEQLYEHFDKVCVIYEGRMAYFGSASAARQHFIDIGFNPAPRQTTADFLVAVTDPSARIVSPGFESRAPRTAGEFAEHFIASEAGRANQADIGSYRAEFVGKPEKIQGYKESARAERATTQSKASPYTVSLFMQARAVSLRRLQILRGNMSHEIIHLVTFILQAVIVGTAFLNMAESTLAYFSRGGVIFFALLFAALTSMSEIPALFVQRPIVIKHYKAAMYHPFIEAAALTLVDIPITFFTLLVFGVILYFLTGLQRSAGQFFIFFIFIFTMTITMKAWFRTIAAAFGAPAPAQTVAGILLLGLVLYTGYAIPKPSMIGALRWITYINPLRWGFEGVLSNEFHTLNGTCATLVPSGPGYINISLSNQVCTTVGSVSGSPVVDGNRFISLSFGYSFGNMWRNFGFVIAFGVLFISGLLLATELNTSTSARTSSILYKRGTTTNPLIDKAIDEEKGGFPEKTPVGEEDNVAQVEKALEATPKAHDVFTWQHLEYNVPVGGGEMRRLLDNVSGYVAPGKLTALMGESGAGKTTLLNVLAQRQTTGIVTGERLVNGHSLPTDFQAQTGYCQQMDTHLRSATVREALLFSARLRQPVSVPMEEKEAYVETVLKICGLQNYADAIVGSLGVEHRKRTTIGVELAAKPKLLLFLDEPTSGLDSQSAWAIMIFLRRLANHGQAILCTIHQPSSELFQVFDRLLLLKKGGQTVYFGDLGPNSTTMLDYFESHGGYPCPPQHNPAEYILDVIGAGATATTEVDWHEIWSKSDEAKAAQKEIGDLLAEGRARPPVQTEIHTEFTTGWLYQVKTLLKRDLQRRWRDPQYVVAKLALNVFAGLFIGFTFWKSKWTIQGTQNKLFAIFLGLVVSAPVSNQLQVLFIEARSIYEVRERPSRMYSWTALMTAQLLSELPWNIFGSSLYFLCWYWTVGFPTERGGYTYLMLAIMFPLWYTSFGQAVAAMSPDAPIAALLFSFLFSFVINFTGVLQPFARLGWWKWMYRLSPFNYLVGGLLGQAIGGYEITCADVEYVTVSPPTGQTCGQYLDPFISFTGGYIVDSNATDVCTYCASRTTDEFLQGNFNIFYSQHWRNFGLLWAYIFFNAAMIYLLTYIFRIRTGSFLGPLKRLLPHKSNAQ